MSFPASEFLDLEQTEHACLFDDQSPVWSPLKGIGAYLKLRLEAVEHSLLNGDIHKLATVGPDVFVAEGATVEANAAIKGPAWIGARTVVRSGAYLRENVIVGEDCVLGNSSEFKTVYSSMIAKSRISTT